MFFLHWDSSFCLWSTDAVQCIWGNKINNFSFSYTERYFKSWTHQEQKKASISYKKKKMNVSTGTSVNNKSSTYKPYSVPSRAEGITVSVFFLLEACLIVAGNFLTIGLFAKEKKLRKKNLLLIVNMAFRGFDFRSCLLGFVCLLMYWAHVSAMEIGYIIQNVAYRLGCRWYHLRAGIINLSCLYSLWTVLRHFSAAETPNSITQSVLHCNCYHLDAGYVCFRGVQYSKILNFKHSSYLCLDVIPFAVSIYCLSL